jgi:uncharacterized protein (UPF0262 family)
MPLSDVRIDEQTWEDATHERRLEWEANVRELLDSGDLAMREDAAVLQVTFTQQHFLLELEDSAGVVVATVDLPHDELAELVREYVDIVRQIASTDGPSGLTRLEALDMAKKVTHDRAGRLLKRRCRELGLDHMTARKLFTLLLSLRVDTTRLVGVHGHRRIR